MKTLPLDQLADIHQEMPGADYRDAAGLTIVTGNHPTYGRIRLVTAHGASDGVMLPACGTIAPSEI